jgi:hypothetical protein
MDDEAGEPWKTVGLGERVGGAVGRGEKAEIVASIHKVQVRDKMVKAGVIVDSSVNGGVAGGLVPTVG